MAEAGDRPQPERVLVEWFGDDANDPFRNAPTWFKKDPAFDQRLRDAFEPHIRRAVAGGYDGWRDTPAGALAFIILLDQFSRNVHRDTPQSFAQDGAALAAALEAIGRGFDTALPPVRAAFIYMPLMHAEDVERQRQCVACFAALAERAEDPLKERLAGFHGYAVSHLELIERFGRFPHRNAILGRPSTPEEEAYLADPDAGF